MTRLLLVRHGQTAWNAVERFRGRVDIELNDVGVWQANRAAEAIRARHAVSAVYCSPLTRARRTAEAISQALGVEAQVLPAILDFSYGEWEGRTPQEVEAAYPELYRLWRTQPQRVRIPGGESLARVRARASAAVEEVARTRPGETVVMVTHRMVCRVLACYLLGLSNAHLWNVDLNTASISLFEHGEVGWTTLLMNDTCHLREAPVV